MTKSDFTQLKSLVVSLVKKNSQNPQSIEELKNLFTSDISSLRRFEQITTIEELINVLEVRGTLCEDNVIALRKISNKLPNKSNIITSINCYEQALVKDILIKPDFSKTNSTKIDLHLIPNDNLKSVSRRKKDLIYETIKQELGKYWMDLGRNLGIREHKLNEINSSCCNTYDKASKLLERYEDKADPCRWFHILCEALEVSKRKDLTKDLQNIMMMSD